MNLDTSKKSQYHSALVKEGPLTVKVLSDVLESKYRKQGESGHLYVRLQTGDYEFAYGGETEDCATAFEGLKGKTVTITARGGRDDATIDINEKAHSAPAEAPSARREPQGGSTPRPFQQNEPAGDSSDFKRSAMKIMNAFYLLKKAAVIECEQTRVDGFDTPPEFFQSQVMSAFISLDRAGKVEQLPSKHLWSIAAKQDAAALAREAGFEGAQPKPESFPTIDGDEIPF